MDCRLSLFNFHEFNPHVNNWEIFFVYDPIKHTFILTK